MEKKSFNVSKNLILIITCIMFSKIVVPICERTCNKYNQLAELPWIIIGCTIQLLYYLRRIWFKSLMFSEKNLTVVCLSHTILCNSVFCNDGHLGFQIWPMYNTLVQDHYYNKWIVCGGFGIKDALYIYVYFQY